MDIRGQGRQSQSEKPVSARAHPCWVGLYTLPPQAGCLTEDTESRVRGTNLCELEPLSLGSAVQNLS